MSQKCKIVYVCDKKCYSRVENVCWVVHAILEGTVEMWEGLCAAAETHVLAEVVAAFGAVAAVVAHDACLYCDTLTDDEVLYTGADGCDGAGCFMAEDEGCLEGKVSVASVDVVVDCHGGHQAIPEDGEEKTYGRFRRDQCLGRRPAPDPAGAARGCAVRSACPLGRGGRLRSVV